MSKKLIVFFKSDGFYMSDCKSPIINFEFNEYTKIPNMPIYHHVWEQPKTVRADLLQFVRTRYNFSRIFKPLLYLIIPDDAIFVDKRCIIEFLLSMGYFKDPVTIHERLLLANNPLLAYIALTESERAICLSFIKGRKTAGIKYFDKKSNDIDRIREEIKLMTSESGFMNVPIYLYGENMSAFQELGELVPLKQMLSNFMFLYEDKKHKRKMKRQS